MNNLLAKVGGVPTYFYDLYFSIVNSPNFPVYVAIGIGVLVVFIFFWLIIPLFLRQLHDLTLKTKNDFDEVFVDVVLAARWPIFFIIVIYSISFLPQLPDTADAALKIILLLFVTYEVIKAANTFVQYGFDKISKKREEKGGAALLPVFSKIVKSVVWIVGVVILLSHFGVEVTPLVTGLGIGGIAVALAVQNILGDLFSSFTIYLDKPFKIGDFIIVDDQQGTVKNIGIKTTRITSLSGEELIMPNHKLVSTVIKNYKRMKKRRVEFHLGVTYETKPAKVKKVPTIIEGAFKKLKGAEFDRAHFESFGPHSLDFEIVYYVLSNDYKEYMDIQQELNNRLFDAFTKEKIEFAYPTQKIFVEK